MWDTYNKGLPKSQEKLIRSLQQKKHREESALFVAEGVKLALELILSDAVQVRKIFATEEFYAENTFDPEGAECFVISEKELAKISSLTAPNQVLVCAEIPAYPMDMGIFGDRLVIVLEDIRDPGNLGTMIRLADWFGIENMICSAETVDAYNSKVIQASMGSIARVKIFYQDLEHFLPEYKKQHTLPVYGTFVSGENVYTSPLSEKGLLIIGNESRGISEAVAGWVDKKLSIPRFRGASGPESLNASAATAIFCSEFSRRKKYSS